jgi:NADH-quinone oxidoreductase subunit G
VAALAEIVNAAASGRAIMPDAALKSIASVPASDMAKAIAASLGAGKNVGIFLGNMAQQHPRAAELHTLVQELARLLGARFGVLGEAANSVGGYIAGCVPQKGGLNAQAMLKSPRKAYLLLNLEPELDCHDPVLAARAMQAAQSVIALTMYRTRVEDFAAVMLPISPFSETSGTFVNTEGRVQSFNRVTKELGDSRPAWKVLRVLGNLLGVAGFDYDKSEQVRDEVCAGDIAARLSNGVAGVEVNVTAARPVGLERIADVPMYFSDPIVRRAPSLQETIDAAPPVARMHPSLIRKLGLAPGSRVSVRQGAGSAIVEAASDPGVPPDCVRLAAGHPLTATLGPMFGDLVVEPAPQTP